MKKEPGLLYRVFLVIGDALAIVFSFAFAYYFRTHIDSRPYFFTSEFSSFVFSIITLLPIWLVILFSLGLYSKRVLSRRPLEYWHLFLASVIGVMTIIAYDFFASVSVAYGSLFPVRIIAIYAVVFCFLSLLIMRTIITFFRRVFLRHRFGLIRTIVVGNSDNTTQLLAGISPESGFEVVGVIARNEYIPNDFRTKKYSKLEDAIESLHPDAIIHTEESDIAKINKLAIDNHALYYYSPSESSVLTLSGNVEFIAATPVVQIRATPLRGAALIYKRLVDVVFGTLLALIASPLILIILLIQKLLSPKDPAFYYDKRLTRFNRTFGLLKFRTIRQEYSGLTPEDAFKKMGRPELAKEYRKNGDQLAEDPRYTRFGQFLRKTSIDELPQLFNVIKGDISLVGPRALQPHELKDYGDRGLLLSIKSGITGLAQVSGRRDISFGERRSLDIYYIQNWSPLLDLQIFFRTIAIVLRRDGAR